MKKILFFITIVVCGIQTLAQQGCITIYQQEYIGVAGGCDVRYYFSIPRNMGYGADVVWYFGDGGTDLSGATVIDHVYTTPGTYTVTVTSTPTGSPGQVTTCTLDVVVEEFSSSVVDFSMNYEDGVCSFVYNGSSVFNTCWIYTLDFGDGTTPVVGNSGDFVEGAVFASHQYNSGGTYQVILEMCICPGVDAKEYYPPQSTEICCFTHTQTIEVDPYECCLNFAPIPGKRYWISAWVQEAWVDEQPLTYDMVDIQIRFEGAGIPDMIFRPEGAIIDGWQRIAGDFVIPENTTDLTIHLMNHMGMLPAFFDDVRIHPWNSSMKSYVYDPETYRLVAELDDNNYATFYEYDNEGQLVRIKKETARGIMTIQESRSHSPIKTNE